MKIGLILLLLGGVFIVVGLGVMAFTKLFPDFSYTSIPLNFEFESKSGTRFYFPLGISILLSFLLSIIALFVRKVL